MAWAQITQANATAGNAILASDHAQVFENINAFGLAWTSWTPTVDATSGWKPTLTNIVSKYLKVGRIVLFYANFSLNTVSTGTGLSLNLPVTGSSTSAFQTCSIQYEDVGTAQYDGIVYGGNATLVNVGIINTAGTYAAVNAIAHTTPFTWGTGDVMRFSGFYEAASI